MHCHCGTYNRAPRWTFTDPCKTQVRPGAREESADVNGMWTHFSKCSDTISTCVPCRQSSQRITQPWHPKTIALQADVARTRQSVSKAALEHYIQLKHVMQEILQHPNQRYVIGRYRWEEVLVLHQRPENRHTRYAV